MTQSAFASDLALVVDDAPELRALLSACLRQLGFRVVTLEDGAGALDLVRRLRPRLVCLDLVLPQVGGLEVCEQLKAAPDTAAIPVLVTSARTSPADRAHAEAAGAGGFVRKPVDPPTFMATVQNLLSPRGCVRDV